MFLRVHIPLRDLLRATIRATTRVLEGLGQFRVYQTAYTL